jgi:hypothetical protein
MGAEPLWVTLFEQEKQTAKFKQENRLNHTTYNRQGGNYQNGYTNNHSNNDQKTNQYQGGRGNYQNQNQNRGNLSVRGRNVQTGSQPIIQMCKG